MMKKNCKVKVISICLGLFILAGCTTIAAPPKQRFIDQAIWPTNTTKDKVYSACLTALTLGGFDIHPLGTSKDNGLIVTGQREFHFQGEGNYGVFTDKKLICYYNLQILVSKNQDNKVMVNVHAKPGWKDISEDQDRVDLQGENAVEAFINNRVAEHLKKFFAQLDILLGKAEYYRGDRVLEWEQ